MWVTVQWSLMQTSRKQMASLLHSFILLIFWSFIFLSSNIFFLDQTKYSLQNPGASQTANSPQWLHDQSCQTGQSAQSWKDSFLEPETKDTQVEHFLTVTLSCLACWCLLKPHKSFEALWLLALLKAKGELLYHSALTELHCIVDFSNT